MRNPVNLLVSVACLWSASGWATDEPPSMAFIEFLGISAGADELLEFQLDSDTGDVSDAGRDSEESELLIEKPPSGESR